MSHSLNMLKDAVRRRVQSCRKDILFHTFLGFVVAVAGTASIAFIWFYYRDDETELIKQSISLGMTLLSAGAGGFFFRRAIGFRERAMLGEQWIRMYEDAIGPPPSQLLADIEKKILDWLEGY